MNDFINKFKNIFFLESPKLPSLPRLQIIAKESVRSTEYYWDATNRNKKRKPRYIIQYTVSGNGVFKWKDELHTLSPGTFFLINSHAPYYSYFYPHKEKTPWEFIFFEIVNGNDMMDDFTNTYGHIFRLPLETFAQKLSRFNEYQGKVINQNPEESALFIMELLSESEKQVIVKEEKSSSTQIIALERFIRDNLSHNLSLQELSDFVSTTPQHLCRLFKKHLNTTPHQYMYQQKIEEAACLLMQSSLSVKEIATMFGFDTSSHFARKFRKLKGESPKEFRRRNFL